MQRETWDKACEAFARHMELSESNKRGQKHKKLSVFSTLAGTRAYINITAMKNIMNLLPSVLLRVHSQSNDANGNNRVRYYGNEYTLLHELACNIASYCTSECGIFTSHIGE